MWHTQEIFDNILDRDISWPDEGEMSAHCRSLIDQLLTINPMDRMGRSGAGEIKLHPWFHGLGLDQPGAHQGCLHPQPGV